MTDTKSIRWAILFLRNHMGPEARQAAKAIPKLLERALELMPNYANPSQKQKAVERDIEVALGWEE